jgi:predicted nucleic acid-binding protein
MGPRLLELAFADWRKRGDTDLEAMEMATRAAMHRAGATVLEKLLNALGCPVVRIPVPTERHGEVLGPLLAKVSRSNLVPDAHLAALAIKHGLILCSTDGDFARFPGLRWENPIQ